MASGSCPACGRFTNGAPRCPSCGASRAVAQLAAEAPVQQVGSYSQRYRGVDLGFNGPVDDGGASARARRRRAVLVMGATALLAAGAVLTLGGARGTGSRPGTPTPASRAAATPRDGTAGSQARLTPRATRTPPGTRP